MKTKTKIFPTFSRVIVKQDDAEEKSPGGIILTETYKQRPKSGTVIAVGPGKSMPDGGTRKMSLKAGDRIIFNSYAATEFKSDGNTYLLMDEDDVLATEEK